MGIEVCFFSHATTWDVEIPRAGNWRTSKDRDTDGYQDISDLESADGVGYEAEGTVGIDTQVEEEDGDLHEEGAEVVGCESSEIYLDGCELD